jgi:uncharacterized membrane protein YkvA (DUF1232 family)
MIEQQDFEHVDAEEINHEDVRDIEDKIVFTDKKKMFDFYEKLRRHSTRAAGNKMGKIGKEITELLLFLPDFFFLLIRLFIDKRTPRRVKIIIGSVITYLVLPWDILPDFIPIIGFVDDFVLIVMALNSMLNEIDPEVILDNWSGKEKLLTLVQRITAITDKFLEKNLLNRIKAVFTKIMTENTSK